MFSDTLELVVLLGLAVVMSFIGHSRSTRYLRTSLLVGVLTTAVWFAFVVARHHAPMFLLRAVLTADLLIVLITITAAGCAVIIALVVGLFFREKSDELEKPNGPHAYRTRIGLAAALLASSLFVLFKACAPSGGPVDPL